MAIEKVITIKANTDQAQQSFDELGRTIQEQTDITIQFEKELQDLEQQLKDTGDASFNPKRAELTKQVDKLKTAIKGQKVALKDLNNERKKADKVLKSNFEEVTKNGGAVAVLDRLTGGLASQVRDSYEATKLFNFSLKGTKTALIATGIGVFVIALGLVVAYWDEIKALINGSNKALERQLDLNTKNIAALDFQVTLLKEQETLLNLQGKSTTANRKEQQKLLEVLVLENTERLEILKTQLESERSSASQVSIWKSLLSKLPGGAGIPIIAIDKDAIQKVTDITKQINDAQIRAVKLQQKLVEINKPSKEDEDALKLIIDKETARQNKILEIQENYRRKNEDAEDVFNIDKIERQKERALLELEALGATELEKLELLKYYNNLLNEAKTKLLNDYQDNLNDEDDEEIKIENDRLKRLYENGQKEIALQKAVQEAKRSALMRTSKLLIELGGSAATIGKGIAVYQTTVSGIEGAQNAYTTAQKSPITAFFPAYPLIQAGLAGAFSALQVKKILSTNPSSVASGSGQTNVGAGGGFSAPSFNLVQGTQGNQIANTVSQGQPPIQAYVVSSQISTAQQLDRSKITDSSI
tara:strand:- start:18263 stop:20023 length:1761 start_codon:yes stop_codon:yes gene_type:complete